MLLLQKLSIGCGRNTLSGWVRLESFALPGVDIVGQLERCTGTRVPLENEGVD
jgi:hypothetical protein